MPLRAAVLGNIMSKTSTPRGDAVLARLALLALVVGGAMLLAFVITVPMEIGQQFLFSAVDFHSCLFFACFVLVLTQSSIFSLLAVAIDRYLAIKIPLR